MRFILISKFIEDIGYIGRPEWEGVVGMDSSSWSLKRWRNSGWVMKWRSVHGLRLWK